MGSEYVKDHIFGKLNQSIIVEHGYSIENNQICILYIVSDGDGDYTQLPIIQSDPLRMGAYGPCPYLTSKQLSYIRRRIVERTLRCSPTIRHLFGFRLLIQGINYNQVYLLDYLSTFEEPEAEILLSLCEPDIFLQYALDLPSVPILPLISKKRRIHCVNTTITSTTKNSLNISNKILLGATKNNKVKIFHNQTDININNNGTNETNIIITNGERIFNVLGYGSTLQEAQIQSVLACEYIKQHTNIDDLLFKSDIGAEAIEWYKTHGDRHHSSTGGLTNGKKKKIKKKKSIITMINKRRGLTTRRRNIKSSEQEKDNENEQIETTDDDDDDDDDEDDDENEPMDFERAFGSISDIPKLEHMDIHQNNGNFDDLNIHEGEFYFDLTTKIDLKNYLQPVLISSTINLNPLAALFNLNDGDMNDSQTVFEYLGHELTVRCANDLICARTLYVQCCSLPISSRRSIQRFYQGIEQACQQLDCTLLKTTTTTISSSLFSSLCTGLCERELIIFNNTNHPIINEGDLLIALRCSSSTVNTQGYIQLKDLFQKKNIHLNDTVPFRTVDGEEESFFSLLLQKSSILASSLSKTIGELIKNRTIKAVRYLKGMLIDYL
ncbi:unnamed protein product [Rotaria sordida]|uniref:Uncharacterized protein n=1 Tax=Rotaria sordida TaxID=392033 RepID=A0A819R4G1_9BILA|nr:unnamed protein product [Rotaria sordida]